MITKVGDFWLPRVDVRWGKRRRKSRRIYGEQNGPKLEDLEEALRYVGSWTVAVDGGANVGAYTRVLMKRFDTVHAFEPAPDTFAALARNVREWGGGDRVFVHQNALSDRDESVSLGGAWRRRSVSRRIVGGGSIATVRIDDFGLDELAFLKLDVEGYEERALRGATETLLRCKPVVMFEDKPHKNVHYGTESGAHDFLRSLGARCIACIGPKQFDFVYAFGAYRRTR